MLKLKRKSNCDYLSFDDIFGKEINRCEESPQPSICYNWNVQEKKSIFIYMPDLNIFCIPFS